MHCLAVYGPRQFQGAERGIRQGDLLEASATVARQVVQPAATSPSQVDQPEIIGRAPQQRHVFLERPEKKAMPAQIPKVLSLHAYENVEPEDVIFVVSMKNPATTGPNASALLKILEILWA